MTITPHTDDPQQHADEDLAADLRDHGHTWPDIAATLGTTIAAAKKYAAASDRRAHDTALRDQATLFD